MGFTENAAGDLQDLSAICVLHGRGGGGCDGGSGIGHRLSFLFIAASRPDGSADAGASSRSFDVIVVSFCSPNLSFPQFPF